MSESVDYPPVTPEETQVPAPVVEEAPELENPIGVDGPALMGIAAPAQTPDAIAQVSANSAATGASSAIMEVLTEVRDKVHTILEHLTGQTQL